MITKISKVSETLQILMRPGIASLAIKILNITLGLVLAVLLTRTLGVQEYGLYSFVFAAVTIIAIPAQIGLPQLIVRETAKDHQNNNINRMHLLWRWSHTVVLFASILILGISILSLEYVGSGPVSQQTFLLGLLLVPAIAFGNLRTSALIGLGRIVIGQFPESVLRPFLLLIIIVVVNAFFEKKLTAESILFLHLIAAGLTFVVGSWLLARNAPERINSERVKAEHRTWLISAAFLGSTVGLQIVNSNFDIILLGLLRDEIEVGVYRIAVMGAGLVAFGIQTMNLVISPRISNLYSTGQMEELQKVVASSCGIVFIFSTFSALALFFFGAFFLEFVFGKDFRTGHNALLILALGHLVSSVFGGSASMVLNMVGHERITLKGCLLGFIANVGLNFLLIPYLGLNGAAIATALSLILFSCILWWTVRRLVAIDTSIISLVHKL